MMVAGSLRTLWSALSASRRMPRARWSSARTPWSFTRGRGAHPKIAGSRFKDPWSFLDARWSSHHRLFQSSYGTVEPHSIATTLRPSSRKHLSTARLLHSLGCGALSIDRQLDSIVRAPGSRNLRPQPLRSELTFAASSGRIETHRRPAHPFGRPARFFRSASPASRSSAHSFASPPRAPSGAPCVRDRTIATSRAFYC
jgi:hypothetical protein